MTQFCKIYMVAILQYILKAQSPDFDLCAPVWSVYSYELWARIFLWLRETLTKVESMIWHVGLTVERRERHNRCYKSFWRKSPVLVIWKKPEKKKYTILLWWLYPWKSLTWHSDHITTQSKSKFCFLELFGIKKKFFF